MDLILTFIVLVAELRALVSVLGSRTPPRVRALWTLVVVGVPVVGFVLWAARGPRKGRALAA